MSDTNEMEKREHPVHHIIKVVLMVIGGILLAILLAFLLGWGIVYLWNWLMPALFGLGKITYWQAVGLFVLAKVLFGFGGGSHDSGHGGKKHKLRFELNNGECGPDWKGKEGWGKWKYYNRYWKEEGKAAFEAFLQKKEAEKGKEDPAN